MERSSRKGNEKDGRDGAAAYASRGQGHARPYRTTVCHCIPDCGPNQLVYIENGNHQGA